MKKYFSVIIFFICVYYSLAQEIRGNSSKFTSSAVISALASYTSALNDSSVILAKSYLCGTTSIKGMIGEQYASNSYLKGILQKSGQWHSISPRIGPQGIDHVFIKVNPKTGLPIDLMIAESKFGSSTLHMTKGGVIQFSPKWSKDRLSAMGDRYYRLSIVDKIQKMPVESNKHEMRLFLKNKKEVVFWRKNSQDSWKFGGQKKDFPEAKKTARIYGNYLSRAGKGDISFRSRLFQIVPKGNDLFITIRDAGNLRTGLHASDLRVTNRVVLRNVLNKKIPIVSEKEIVKMLRAKNPSLSNKEILSLAKKINLQLKDILQPYGKMQMLGTIASHAGISSLSAMALDSLFQYSLDGRIDPNRLLLTGNAVFAGIMIAQLLEANWGHIITSSGVMNSLGISSVLLSQTVGTMTGGMITGTLLAYGGWYMGKYDIQTANIMALTNGLSAGIGTAAGLGTMAAIAAWGTAGTGTAIATLSGAAASSAILASIGGGSAIVGGTILTGGTLLVAVSAGITISYWADYYITH